MKFRGRVVAGQNLARTLDVPTANLELAQRPKIKDGVWLVWVRFNDQEYGGVLHAGVRQTDNQWSLEVHILNFSGHLLDTVLEIETIEFVRGTQHFDSLSALQKQIHSDVRVAQKFFLRKHIWNQWKTVSVAERERLAHAAVEAISALPEFQAAKTVYAFAPDTTEIDFISQLCDQNPDKQFAFPLVRKWDMTFYLSAYKDLIPGTFGIPEPLANQKAPSPDFVMVPAVAAALTGERLGRGGGYYDAFLASVDVPTVCILPTWAVFAKIPFEFRDQRVGKVLGV